MALKIWLDDKLVDEADAKISVFDHGLLYGDGVFEGIRVYNGRIFELGAHIRRLYESAKVIRLEVPMSRDELISATEKTVEANGVVDGYIRLVVTRGIGSCIIYHSRQYSALSGRALRNGNEGGQCDNCP